PALGPRPVAPRGIWTRDRVGRWPPPGVSGAGHARHARHRGADRQVSSRLAPAPVKIFWYRMQALLVLVSIFLVTVPAWAGRPEAPAAGPRAGLRPLEVASATVAARVPPAVVNVSAFPRKDAPPAELERFREFFGDEFVDRFRRRRDEPRATGSG